MIIETIFKKELREYFEEICIEKIQKIKKDNKIHEDTIQSLELIFKIAELLDARYILLCEVQKKENDQIEEHLEMQFQIISTESREIIWNSSILYFR
ncbi:hypothetical protein [bacterium endosymbiont of Pedicinus badii]|uniref:hypothetical protein n=1 Tax=bacterium endosymbiont of Pedicinus badii TaxID=1719126 RepID=UPI0009BBD188|nr:hypothetical protein [bacterium endosymbiont of Pedicinus badii]OQM34371.1 hypothetical protein AOQ89_00565 [bacterium endosymbiont of Pedicinus badii]